MIVDASGFIKAVKEKKIETLKDSKSVPLIYYELGNFLWKEHKIFRKISQNEAQTMLKDWTEFIENFMKLFEPEWSEVLQIAKSVGLSYYDACYLWLAKKLDEPILTLDKKLGKLWKIAEI